MLTALKVLNDQQEPTRKQTYTHSSPDLFTNLEEVGGGVCCFFLEATGTLNHHKILHHADKQW